MESGIGLYRDGIRGEKENEKKGEGETEKQRKGS